MNIEKKKVADVHPPTFSSKVTTDTSDHPGFFVALHHTERGFVGYNTYTNSKGPDRYGESLQEFLKRRKYYATFLVAIRRKDAR